MIRKYIIIALLIFPSTAYAVFTGGAGHDNPEVWAGVAGQMYISTPGTVTITTGLTYEKCDEAGIAWTGEHLEWFNETTDGRLTYTGVPTKDISCVVTGSVESGETAQEVLFKLYDTGNPLDNSEIEVSFTTINNHFPFSLGSIVEMQTNDYLELYCTSDQDGDELILHAVNISCTQYE